MIITRKFFFSRLIDVNPNIAKPHTQQEQTIIQHVNIAGLVDCAAQQSVNMV